MLVAEKQQIPTFNLLVLHDPGTKSSSTALLVRCANKNETYRVLLYVKIIDINIFQPLAVMNVTLLATFLFLFPKSCFSIFHQKCSYLPYNSKSILSLSITKNILFN